MNSLPRRSFLAQSALGWIAAHTRSLASQTGLIQERRQRTLAFIESMRFKNGPFGRYRHAADMPEPTLYSSTYAAMTRSLYRDLHTLSKTQRDEWIADFQSH